MIARLGLERQKSFDALLLESELDKPKLHLPERIIIREVEVAGLGDAIQTGLATQYNRVEHRIKHEQAVRSVAAETGLPRGSVDAMMSPSDPPSSLRVLLHRHSLLDADTPLIHPAGALRVRVAHQVSPDYPVPPEPKDRQDLQAHLREVQVRRCWQIRLHKVHVYKRNG